MNINKDILGRISTEVGALMKRRSDVDGVILDINRDFVEKNFAGVIKSIELRAMSRQTSLCSCLYLFITTALRMLFL